MPIYSNIKEACKKNGISVTKLEMDLGFARSSIYKWDKHQPAIGKIKKVSDYLNIPMEKLLLDQKEVNWKVDFFSTISIPIAHLKIKSRSPFFCTQVCQYPVTIE